MLPCRLINHDKDFRPLPLYLYCIGCHNQNYLTRPEGFPAHQIFITKSGNGVFRIFEKEDIELGPGTALILPAGVAHEYFPVGEEPWELAFVCIQGILFESLIKQLGIACLKKIVITFNKKMDSLFEELWNGCECSGYSTSIESSSKLYEFLLLLSSNYLCQENSSLSSKDDYSTKIAKYINEHYFEQLTLQDLANMAGYSPQQLERIFLKRYHLTLHTYLERIRLQQAVNLLHERKDMKIHEVAEKVGFETGYFIRLFKKYMGVTPKRYRVNPFLMEKSLFDFLK